MLKMHWSVFCVAIVLALAEGRWLNQEKFSPQAVTVKFQVTFADKQKPNTPIADVTSTSSNALDVLDAANRLANKCYESKHRPGIYGPVVREVCQVPNEERPGKHWVVYLNDKAVDFSVACYQLKNKDFLRLNYETKKTDFNEFEYLKFQASYSIKVKFQVTFANLEHPNTPIIEVSVNSATANGVDVLEAANQNDDDCYHSQWIPKKYGPYIILVCNTPRDRHLNKNWVLYVNNKLADHSVACYRFKSGDFIRLNYETTKKAPKTLKDYSPQTVTIKLQVTFTDKEKPNTPIADVTTLTGNGLDVLNAANRLANKCYESKHRPGKYGPFVREVCQVPNEEGPGKHWVLYLNGKSIDFSIACYQLKNEDFLRLNYETTKHIFHWYDYPHFQSTIKVKFQVTFANLEKPDTPIVEISMDKSSVNGVDVLEAAMKLANSCYHSTLVPKKYGPYVQETCDVPRNKRLRTHWVLYVNNKLAELSVACYQLRNGDFVRLNYETMAKEITLKMNPVAAPKSITVKFQVTFNGKMKASSPELPLILTAPKINGIDLLDKARENSNYCYHSTVVPREYGPEVLMVCDLPRSSTMHWVVYVNGKVSDISIACYQLNNGDTVRVDFAPIKTFNRWMVPRALDISQAISVTLQVTFAEGEKPDAPKAVVTLDASKASVLDVLDKANVLLTSCYQSRWVPRKYGPYIMEVCSVPHRLGKEWVLYINGEATKLSAACYQVKNKDALKFSFETTKNFLQSRSIPRIKSSSTAAPKITVKYQVTFANLEKPNTPIVDVDMKSPRITAYDLLDKSYQLKDRCYRAQMTPRKYGPHVFMVCDVANDTPAGKHWVMYLNGVASNLNSACYKLKNGDFVRMTYETSKKDVQIFSSLKPQLVAPKTISVGFEVTFALHEKPDAPRVTITLDSPRINGIDLLDKANSLTNACYHSEVTPERYGPYIDTVCDMSYDRGIGEFWYIYINGKLEDSSISCYQLKNGDVVRLTFQKLKDSLPSL